MISLLVLNCWSTLILKRHRETAWERLDIVLMDTSLEIGATYLTLLDISFRTILHLTP